MTDQNEQTRKRDKAESLAYKKEDIEAKERWIAALDDKTCEVYRELNTKKKRGHKRQYIQDVIFDAFTSSMIGNKQSVVHAT